MQVFQRFGRMVRADAHGVIDQLEERSLLLKQHLREAELEVQRKRASIDALDEERRRISEQGRTLEAEVARLDEDIEMARSGDDQDLVRFAIRRWLPKRDALRDLCDHARHLEDRRATLFEILQAQEGELAALRPRVSGALARSTPDTTPACSGTSVTDEEVELELIRRRQGRSTSVDQLGADRDEGESK